MLAASPSTCSPCKNLTLDNTAGAPSINSPWRARIRWRCRRGRQTAFRAQGAARTRAIVSNQETTGLAAYVTIDRDSARVRIRWVPWITPVRCLRPAHRVDHLHAVESVPGDHGSRPLYYRSVDRCIGICFDSQRRSSALSAIVKVDVENAAAPHQSPGSISGTTVSSLEPRRLARRRRHGHRTAERGGRAANASAPRSKAPRWHPAVT